MSDEYGQYDTRRLFPEVMRTKDIHDACFFVLQAFDRNSANYVPQYQDSAISVLRDTLGIAPSKCRATTKRGTPCTRTAVNCGLCGQHLI